MIKDINELPLNCRIFIYGTGEGAKLAYKWVSQFKHIQHIVFIDRKTAKTRFMNRKIEHYTALKHLPVDLVLIGVSPVFVPEILENLKPQTLVPIYEFGS